MQTLWKWNFCEGITTEGRGRGGEQRAYAGDNVVVVEPDIGVCSLERIEGAGDTAILYVKHTSGEGFEIMDVPAGNAYVVASRPDRLDPEKTGRRAKGHTASITTMFGAGAVAPTQVGGGRGRGGGRGGAFGKKRKGSRASSAPPTARQRTLVEPPQEETVEAMQALLGAE